MSTRIVVQHGWHGYKYWKVCVWQYILVEIVLPLHTNSCIKKRARQTTADGSREVPCCTDPLCVQIFSLLDIFQTSVTHRWALRSCLWTVHTVISVPMTLLCLESRGFFLLFKKKKLWWGGKSGLQSFHDLFWLPEPHNWFKRESWHKTITL